jgi:hypothetical protein
VPKRSLPLPDPAGLDGSSGRLDAGWTKRRDVTKRPLIPRLCPKIPYNKLTMPLQAIDYIHLLQVQQTYNVYYVKSCSRPPGPPRPRHGREENFTAPAGIFEGRGGFVGEC